MDEHEMVREIIRMKDAGSPLVIDPERSALLVTDVQRYFVSPDDAFGQVLETLMPGVTAGYFTRVRESVIPNIQRVLACCRALRMPIFYTAAGSRLPDGSDLPGWMKAFDQLGLTLHDTRVFPPVHDPSWQVDGRVTPLAGDVVLDKPSSGPLASTRLDQTLRNIGVDTLIVTGLTTDVCVAQAARELADRGFQVIVVEDACTALSEQMHQAALLGFSLTFGRVRTTEALLAMLPDTTAVTVPG
ncbi:MAG TPA: isochorismatase family cysteine hydrolase [Dehalococcoidia bacterium]|nr:isochorismatase family cysteine hydrolase [Dehalococcoidia bacterium]